MTGNSNSRPMSSNKERILSIVTGGIAVALSFLLSNIKLFEMPMGGSVTPASLLPLVIYAIAFGPGWGFVAAVVYSVLQVISGLEWFVTPFQMILDYVLGYTAYGITGFAALKAESRLKFKNPLTRFANGSIVRAFIFVIIAYAVRWFCSVLSGVIFYSEYAAEAGFDNAWVYSMTYNGSFLAVDMVFLLIVMVVLYIVLKKVYKKPVK